MLIPGPKSPGNNIDVYLQPLIDELKELWEKGVETWDAKVKKNFYTACSSTLDSKRFSRLRNAIWMEHKREVFFPLLP